MTQIEDDFTRLNIPHKSFFKSDEVSALTGIKPYVLRFWEKEFLEISPMVSSSGQKLYELKDMEMLMLVKRLLYVEKKSIEEAKEGLREFRLKKEGEGIKEVNSCEEAENNTDALRSKLMEARRVILEGQAYLSSVSKDHGWVQELR